MPRAPRLTGLELIQSLQERGFEVVRTKGSHRRLRHENGRVTTVPVHGNEIIGPGVTQKDIAGHQSEARGPLR